MKKEKPFLTIQLSDDLLSKLKTYAQANELSLSAAMRLMVVNGLKGGQQS